MPNLSYQIEVDDSQAVAGAGHVEQAFDAIENTGRRVWSAVGTGFATMAAAAMSASRGIVGGFTAASQAASSFAAFAVRTTEATLATAASMALAAGEIAKYTAAAGHASSVTETLVSLAQNTFRAWELVTTGFAASTFALIGFGIAAEAVISKVVRLTNARAKLIEQESLLAAQSGLSINTVQRADTVAAIGGGNAANARTLASALGSRIDEHQTTVRGGLDALGISPSLGQKNDAVDPALLQKIAEGFASIEDPAKRAAAAVAIFGQENAGTALAELTPAFANASAAAAKYGATLDTLSRNQIYQFRRDMQSVKTALTDFSAVKGWWESFKTGTEIVTAAAYDMAKRVAKSVDDAIASVLPLRDLQQNLDQVHGLSPVPELPPGPAKARDDATQKTLVADDILAQANAIKARADETLEGQKALAAKAREESQAAYKKLADDAADRYINPTNPKLLQPDDRFRLAQQQQAASQRAVLLEQHAKELQDAKDAADSKEKLTQQINRQQVELKHRADELLTKVILHPEEGAGAFDNLKRHPEYDSQGNVTGVRYFGQVTDKDGQIHEFQVASETIKELLQSRAAYAKNLNLKNSKEEIKAEEEIFQRRKAYEDQIFQKRQEYNRQTLEMETATSDRVYAHANDLAGYTRDERLQQLQLSDPQTERARLGAAQQKLGIETDYITTTAVNNAQAIARKRDRDVGQLELESTGIDKQQATDVLAGKFDADVTAQRYAEQLALKNRIGAINSEAAQSAKEISDKYDHDLIAATQNAQIESTAIVRDAQKAQFESLKSTATGVLNSIESHSQNVFQAIGNVLKSTILTALNEIVSSQIAASLFKVLNPGESVTFDNSRTGGLLGALGLAKKAVFSGGVPESAAPAAKERQDSEVTVHPYTDVTGLRQSFQLLLNDAGLAKRRSPSGQLEILANDQAFKSMEFDDRADGVTFGSASDFKKSILKDKGQIYDQLRSLLAGEKINGPVAIFRDVPDQLVETHERIHVGQGLATNNAEVPFSAKQFSSVFGLDRNKLQTLQKEFGGDAQAMQAELPAYVFEKRGNSFGKDIEVPDYFGIQLKEPVNQYFNRYVDTLEKNFPGSTGAVLQNADPSLAAGYLNRSQPHFHRSAEDTSAVSQATATADAIRACEANTSATDRNTDALQSLTAVLGQQRQEPEPRVETPKGPGFLETIFPGGGLASRAALDALLLTGTGLSSALPAAAAPIQPTSVSETVRYEGGTSELFPAAVRNDAVPHEIRSLGARIESSIARLFGHREDSPTHASKVDLPNHVGDVSLSSGAVPVLVVNQAAAQQAANQRSASSSAGGSAAALGGGLLGGLLGSFGANSASPPTGATAVSSAIQFEGQSGFSGLGSTVSRAGEGSFTSGGESLGIPSGYGLPSAQNLGAPASSSSFGGFNLAGLKGLVFNSGEIQVGPGVASSAAGISQSLGGGTLGSLAGGAAGFASSAAGGLIGASLLSSGLQGKSSVASGIKNTTGGALLGANIGSKIPGLGIAGGALVGAGAGLAADGIKRGGFVGLGEDVAGGAAIGFQFGGPVGALIGAGVGAAIGTVRLFFKGARQKIKDLIQQVYGIKVDDNFADMVQQLAKQKYGGDWQVAVRTQEVRDLLKLFAQAHGDKAQSQFVADTVHSASLVQTRGQLTQQAIYDNGQAYTYASSLPTLNGISSSPLPTVARGAGSTPNYSGPVIVQVSPEATEQLWKSGTAAAIQGNPRLVAQSAVNGYSQSAGRSGNAVSVLSPSAITR